MNLGHCARVFGVTLTSAVVIGCVLGTIPAAWERLAQLDMTLLPGSGALLRKADPH